MEKREIALLRLFTKKLLVERGNPNIDLSKDIESLKDKDFNTAKQVIEKKISEVAPQETKTKKRGRSKKPQKPKKSAEERRKELEQLNKLVQEANSEIKCENQDINKYYERLRKSVEMVAKGYFNSTFLKSRTGLGKSFQVTATLNELGLKSGQDYVEFAGDISPAFIYRFVYENNGKIIVFRDLTRLLQELRSLDMLKAMTETTEKRIVRRAIYNRDLDDLPQFFECKSRFVFEFNSLHFNGLKEDIDALLSRGDFVNLVLSMEDVANIMKQIAQKDEEKEVTEFLIKNYKYVGMNTLNLRSQQKAFQIYKYSQENGGKWQEQIKRFLTSEMTTIRKMLYGLIGEKVIRSADLKRLLVMSHIDGVSHLRTASRRIQDWILLRELFIYGFVCDDDDELEQYLNTHRNFAVCINPKETITLNNEANGHSGHTLETKQEQVKAEG